MAGDDDEIVSVNVVSLAHTAAECEEIVLRETKTTRLTFHARLVDGGSADAGVRGSLIFHRKSPNEEWEDCNILKLSSLKAGEAVSIELKSADVLGLRQWLTDLQVIKDEYGVPPQNTRFVGIRKDPLAGYFGGDPVKVLVPNNPNSQHLVEALTAVLSRDDLDSVAAALKTASVEKLLSLRRTIGVSALDALLNAWDADPKKDDEEHWQTLLTKYAFALEQVFHTGAILHKDKAYVGGKSFDNANGNIADFLLKHVGTGRAMLIEIKKPTTDLIGGNKPYRNNVWNVDKELSGSMLQALTYRDKLHEAMRQVDPARSMLAGALPGCAVIVGHTDSLDDDDKRRSFELARQRPDVLVITFDELRDRLVSIKDALLVDEPLG